MKYRLYIDEVGNSDMGASEDPNHRYLNLTGVIIDLEHVKRVVYPQMEALKQRFFNSHPDEPVILHRREITRQTDRFFILKDPEIRALFDVDLLNYLRDWDYRVISVTIDKLELQKRYQVWTYHPYHYCLHVLLERYVMFLENQNAQGDVMAEARGGKEDSKLKDSFTRIYSQGTQFVDFSRFQAVLTSRQIKLKQKMNNIAGLQLADLLAHPSHKAILASRQRQKAPDDFGGKIADILLNLKYLKSPSGIIEGWGRKWLP